MICRATISIMKRYIYIILAIAIPAYTLMVTGNVHAQSGIESLSAKRSAMYGINFPVSLSVEDTQLLSERCPVIQKKVTEASDRVGATIESREATYGNIEKKLAAIQSRLSLQRLDTSVIDLVLANFRIEVSYFKTSAENYKSVLDDAAMLDCQNNPALFKSAILAARDARLQPVNAMKKIRDLYSSSMINGFELLLKQLYESN